MLMKASLGSLSLAMHICGLCNQPRKDSGAKHKPVLSDEWSGNRVNQYIKRSFLKLTFNYTLSYVLADDGVKSKCRTS